MLQLLIRSNISRLFIEKIIYWWSSYFLVWVLEFLTGQYVILEGYVLYNFWISTKVQLFLGLMHQILVTMTLQQLINFLGNFHSFEKFMCCNSIQSWVKSNITDWLRALKSEKSRLVGLFTKIDFDSTSSNWLSLLPASWYIQLCLFSCHKQYTYDSL